MEIQNILYSKIISNRILFSSLIKKQNERFTQSIKTIKPYTSSQIRVAWQHTEGKLPTCTITCICIVQSQQYKPLTLWQDILICPSTQIITYLILVTLVNDIDSSDN